jgi:phosphohistidine phosphatase
MKTLCIIRHAKSSWANEELHDIERPLADRGLKDAPAMAKILAKKHLMPDLIFSSPALRAFSTARIFCDGLGIDKNKISIHNDLYFANHQKVIKLLQTVGAGPDVIFLFGHNPTLSNLCHALCHTFKEEIPTCGIVIMQFAVDSWGLVEEGTGKLADYTYPKKLK